MFYMGRGSRHLFFGAVIPAVVTDLKTRREHATVIDTNNFFRNPSLPGKPWFPWADGRGLEFVVTGS